MLQRGGRDRVPPGGCGWGADPHRALSKEDAYKKILEDLPKGTGKNTTLRVWRM